MPSCGCHSPETLSAQKLSGTPKNISLLQISTLDIPVSPLPCSSPVSQSRLVSPCWSVTARQCSAPWHVLVGVSWSRPPQLACSPPSWQLKHSMPASAPSSAPSILVSRLLSGDGGAGGGGAEEFNAVQHYEHQLLHRTYLHHCS